MANHDISDNPVAVITGASSGIGRATALEFAKKGYDVVLAARRQTQLEAVAEQCEQYGIRAMVVAANTSIEEDVQKIATVAVEALGRIDVWVNGAAVSVYAKFEETPTDDFRQVFETNVLGYAYGSRAAIKRFKLQEFGTLINISSVNAVAPVPYSSAYVASKYAVRGMTESLRMELQIDGWSKKIHVCNVMPASIDTNFFQNAANYTRRDVQALEPVYDPTYVATHIVKLARHPKREIIVGPAGKLMALQHALMPRTYEKFIGRFTDKSNFGTSSAEISEGSIYQPIQEHTGTHGGWKEKKLRADQLNAAIGAATAVVVATASIASIGYWFAKKKR